MTTKRQVNVEALLARLQMLEDERAIMRTLHEFTHTQDYGAEGHRDDWFIPNRIIEGTWRGERQHVSTSGRAPRPDKRPETNCKHMLMNTVIKSLNGSEAHVESYWAYLIEGENRQRPNIQSFGRYIDTLRRGKDGEWRIEKRIVEVEGRSAARQQNGHHRA